MTDEAGVATAPPVAPPSADVPVPASAEPIAAPVVPEGEALPQGNSRQDARRRAKARGSARAAADAAVRENAQARVPEGTPEGGQFSGEPGAEPPAALEGAPAGSPDLSTPGADVPGAGSAIDAGAATATAPPEGFIDIPLPDNHPLRDRGQTHIRAWKEQEAEVRNGINSAVENRELRERLSKIEREATLERARAAALSDPDAPRNSTSVEFQTMLQQVRDAPGFGDEVADRILAGEQALEAQRVIEAQNSALDALQIREVSGKFSAGVYARAGEVLEVWRDSGELEGRLGQLIPKYGYAVDARNERDGTPQRVPDVDEFFRWVGGQYQADPRVRSKITAIQAETQAQTEARIRADERARIAAEEGTADEAAARHAVRPPLNPPTAASTTRPGGAGPEPAPLNTGKSRKDRRAQAVARIAERARQR